MENSNETNILNEIKIVDNIGKDDSNLPDIEIETQENIQKISVIVDQVSENKNDNSDNNNINNQETSNINNDNISTNQSPKDQKIIHITSSCSLGSAENILKDNSDGQVIIEEEVKNNLKDSHFITENKSIDKKNLLTIKLIDSETSSRKLYSMTNLELKDGVDSSNKDISANEFNSCDQLHPPKTKRPSTNFIKHITGFSELTSKSKSKNKGTPSLKDENKKSKKIIIRSESNIIGEFENGIDIEKSNFKLMENFDEYDYKKRYKSTDDHPSHTRSFQSFNNYNHNILSSSYLTETEMNNSISKAYSKSMPATINFHNFNPVMNPEHFDIIDQNYVPVKSNNTNNNNNNNNYNNSIDLNNLFNTESNSNGNINYNDFLFDDEQDNNGTDSPTTPGKEVKKKSKINDKNVTFIDSENIYIPNLYKKDNAEERKYFCNNCKKNVDITIKREYTTTLWVLFIILLICGLIFAWIPFLFKRFKYYSFYCKVCKKRVIK